nr:BNR-4 repeat-containing protein [uncultured Erwinia sp.]
MALSGGTLGFDSETALRAYIPAAPHTVGIVVTTGAAWLWNGSAWSYSGLSFTEQAMQYVDELLQYTEYALSALTGEYYLSYATGTRIASTSWRCSDFIPVRAGAKIKLTAVATAEAQANLCFYDENQIFVSAARTGTDGNVASLRLTAPVSGYIRLCTRTATSTTFSCRVTSPALSASELGAAEGMAKTLSLAGVASGHEAVIEISGATKSGSIATGYIDNAGAVVASSARRYRSVRLLAGETAYYRGYTQSSPNAIDQFQAAVFRADSGNVTFVEGLPRALTASSWYEGEFTATADGYLYTNLMSDPKNTRSPYGYLLAGVPGETVIYSPDKLMQADIGVSVAGKDLNDRDMEAIKANGEPVDVTGTAEMLYDRALYSNGAYQDFSLTTLSGVWCMKLVAARAGDKFTFQAYFDTSTTQILSYCHQLDERKKYVAEIAVVPSGTGYRTVTLVATRDGYVAFRVRLVGPNSAVLTHTISRTGPQYINNATPSIVKGSSSLVAPSMERLPVKLDATWLYNSPAYQQNGVVSAGNWQYVVCIAEGRKPHILQRSIYGGPWSVFDLSALPGNPFQSPNAQDGHNSFSVTVTRDGYIIVTGNHHATACKCVISASPHTITAWTQISYTSLTVTYPRFLTYPDGTTQVMWRRGGSGNGTYYVSTFDDTSRTFNGETLLIDAPDGGNPYEQTVCVDNAGVLHLCWGYRTTGSTADSNYGMYYAKSADKGTTFTSADGAQSYPVPLSGNNAERPVVVLLGSGYVNQNGACVDLKGYFHTVYWQRDPQGYTQIVHLYFTGSVWVTETVSAFEYTEDVSGGLLNGTSSRPLIVCTRYGKLYVIYRTTEGGLGGSVRCIDVTVPGLPVDQTLAGFNVNKTELSVNVREVLKTGVLSMMLYTGVNRTLTNPEGEYLSECAWLMQAQLP